MKINRFIVQRIAAWMERGNEKRRKRTKLDHGSQSLYDINYVKDGDPHHCFDLLKADSPNRLNRLIVDLHGGAYIYGTRKNNHAFASFFRSLGYDVCLGDYDLVAGDVTVENQIHDCTLLIKYLREHVRELGIEADDVFLSGDSSGGHLALLLAEAFSDPFLAAQLKIELHGLSIKAVLVNCPVYDFAEVTGKSLCTAGAARYVFGPHFSEEPWFRKFSPRTYLKQLKVPLFFSSSRHDPLLREAKKLECDLQKSSLPYEFVYIRERGPKTGHIHNVSFPDTTEARRVNLAMATFMDKWATNLKN